MKLTGATRVAFACGVFLSIIVYLLIVDLGLHAGKVHRGVTVQGVPVGGLTQAEAQRRLGAYGSMIRRGPIVLTTQGYDCRLTPRSVGWRASPSLTAQRAMAVGRSDGPVTSLRERLRSWFGGVSIAWPQGAPPGRVAGFVEDCARRGEDFGVRVDRVRLATEVTRLLGEWPRDQLHELPLEQ